MENTTVQKRIIKAYEDLTERKEVYPTFKVLAKKARVSIKYAHYVITKWKSQNQTFGIKK